jgi:fructokinase
MVVNLVDPDVIVLGGGMSNVAELYERTPAVIAPRIFSDVFETPIRPPMHGDSSGVRGAAWLWPLA